jgi:hypothetical protein
LPRSQLAGKRTGHDAYQSKKSLFLKSQQKRGKNKKSLQKRASFFKEVF